jgi:heme/copper-type cytochrome/quinol oxidase subunit 3
MNKFLILLLSIIFPSALTAQTAKNFMYSGGRIYVVIAVLLVIFIGIIFYLVKIEREIKKLKKDHDE